MIDWVWNIFIMTASLAFVELVLPEGGIQKYLKFIFSLMVLAVIVYPIGEKQYEEISAGIALTQDSRTLTSTEDNRMLERIIETQTRQLEDIYREKAAVSDPDRISGENSGISLPWADIYSNDKEEPN